MRSVGRDKNLFHLKKFCLLIKALLLIRGILLHRWFLFVFIRLNLYPFHILNRSFLSRWLQFQTFNLTTSLLLYLLCLNRRTLFWLIIYLINILYVCLVHDQLPSFVCFNKIFEINRIEKNRFTEENTNIGYCARKFAGEANRHLCLTAENAKEHNTKIMHRDDAADSAN